MQEYIYTDFTDILNDTDQCVANIVHDHITSRYPDYKPFDIRRTNKAGAEWLLNYRKRPKTGKAICALEASDGKLTIRFSFLSSMSYEFLLRQNEFSAKTKNHILSQLICCVDKACRCYGGNILCSFQQNYLIFQRLVKSCPYPWIYFDWFTQDDSADIRLLIDLQMKHMTQNAKDIKGGTYTEETRKRCGNVNVITIKQTKLDIDDFEIADYCNEKRSDRYTAEYCLTPMGAYDGLWFYHDQKAVCGEGGNDYRHTMIPEGRYATVTINDPFSFSAWRVWNYIAGWIRENDAAIRTVDINERNVPYYVRFYRQDGGEFMSTYVPIT